MNSLWIICLTLTVKIATSEIAKNKLSCNFHDTINISSGTLNEIGQFHHNGVKYDKHLFAEFDYVITNSSMVKVEPHIRGCICLLKNCVRVCRFCSDDDESLNMRCFKKSSDMTVPSSNLKPHKLISLELDEFVILEGKLCQNYYKIDFEEYGESDHWIFLPVIINFAKSKNKYKKIQ